MTDVLEELLDISNDTAYKRINAERDFSFSELIKVCRKYNVSLDEIVHKKSNQGALFHYDPIIISDQESCINYLQQLLDNLLSLKSSSDKEIICISQVIPFYLFVKYPDLTFFTLYAWNENLDYNSFSFEKFDSSLNKVKFLSIFEQIFNTQMYIPLTEIWSLQSIDTTLKLIEYYFEIGAFENKKTPLNLLVQLLHLLDMIKQYASAGYKDSTGKVPFAQYVCSVDLGNSLMLLRYENRLSCTLRLISINSISTENEFLCSDIQKWINDLISKSIPISGKSSEKERYKFYKAAETKINLLAEKIKSS